MGEARTVAALGKQPAPVEHRGVAALKRTDGPDLLIQGSSTFYGPLIGAGLIDRLVLIIHPLLLGAGKRLLGDGTPPRTLRLIDHRVGKGGVIVAHYEPVGAVATGDMGPRARASGRPRGSARWHQVHGDSSGDQRKTR